MHAGKVEPGQRCQARSTSAGGRTLCRHRVSHGLEAEDGAREGFEERRNKIRAELVVFRGNGRSSVSHEGRSEDECVVSDRLGRKERCTLCDGRAGHGRGWSVFQTGTLSAIHHKSIFTSDTDSAANSHYNVRPSVLGLLACI